MPVYKTDLVSYWKMDETSGTRYDSHGSNDLTDNNTVSYATGKQGNCADLEWDNTEWLSCASNSTLQLSADQDFTISLWVNLENMSGYTYRPMVTKAIATNSTCEFCIYYYYAGADPNNKFRFQLGNGSTYQLVNETVSNTSNGTWFFLVAWHSKTDDKIYLQVNNDATPAEAAWSNGTYSGGTGELAIGRFSGNSTTAHHYDGKIDEVAFWKRLLTSDERTALYNSGNGITYEDLEEEGSGAITRSYGTIF